MSIKHLALPVARTIRATRITMPKTMRGHHANITDYRLPIPHLNPDYRLVNVQRPWLLWHHLSLWVVVKQMNIEKILCQFKSPSTSRRAVNKTTPTTNHVKSKINLSFPGCFGYVQEQHGSWHTHSVIRLSDWCPLSVQHIFVQQFKFILKSICVNGCSHVSVILYYTFNVTLGIVVCSW